MSVKPVEEIPFKSSWPDPDPRFLRTALPPAPELKLLEVLEPRLANWIESAAEAKGAPVDYVFAALLAVAGATIGNSRWVSPWRGWEEPPIIWVMCIGLPSAGKSPAIDAALQPLRKAERPLRVAADALRKEWDERAEVAKLAEGAWKDDVKTAMKNGEAQPDRPSTCDMEPRPHVPRLVVNDSTIEKLGAILSGQPRGTLQMRDEFAGWLEGMARYSGGGSDRPFWLEAYGGRSYSIERMSREPQTIERLSVGVLGGIQPDRLKSLLFKTDDDGLLARFIPIWPQPAPLRRPQAFPDEELMDRAVERLLTLNLVTDETGETRPVIVNFNDGARTLMDEFRIAAREWEAKSDGLMLSFIGKFPGLAARLSLVLAFLDWATGDGEEPQEIGEWHFGRAAHMVESYILPMACRAYADAATSKVERAARMLVSIIRRERWQEFSTRDVQRIEAKGLASRAELDPVLVLLEEADCIRRLELPPKPLGGRPNRLFAVNPALCGV